jgi:hypothetical protein
MQPINSFNHHAAYAPKANAVRYGVAMPGPETWTALGAVGAAGATGISAVANVFKRGNHFEALTQKVADIAELLKKALTPATEGAKEVTEAVEKA